MSHKHMMCRFWVYGQTKAAQTKPDAHFVRNTGCRYGDRCDYAHGADEIVYKGTKEKIGHNYKKEPCRNILETGFCSFGVVCFYDHEPWRKWHSSLPYRNYDEKTWKYVVGVGATAGKELSVSQAVMSFSPSECPDYIPLLKDSNDIEDGEIVYDEVDDKSTEMDEYENDIYRLEMIQRVMSVMD